MALSQQALKAKRLVASIIGKERNIQTLYRAGAFEMLDRCYSSDDRAYHGWGHILDLLEKNQQFKQLAVRPDLIAHAILWHDAVYCTRNEDGTTRPDYKNVKDSADLFMRYALLPELDRYVVYGLIMATAGHFNPPPSAEFYKGFSADRTLMIDYDLSPLAAAPHSFDGDGDKIRHEYKWVDEKTFCAARGNILAMFATHNPIYKTPALEILWGDGARSNLERAARQYAARAAVLA